MFSFRSMKYLLYLVIIMISMSQSAYAEVLDKEPSLTLNYLYGSIGTILCFISARYKPWTLLIIAPSFILYFLSLMFEVIDPYIEEALLREAGKMYILGIYLFNILIVFSIALGLWLRKNRTIIKRKCKTWA